MIYPSWKEVYYLYYVPFFYTFLLQIIIYEINRAKGRHKVFRSILLPQPPQSLDILGDGRLAVGFQSAFTIYSILGDQQPLCKLIWCLGLNVCLYFFSLFFSF